LKGVSFEISEREILGIIGPSGGGKSTLLRCLNFLEWPGEGSIQYNGRVCLAARDSRVEITSGDGSRRELEEADLCAFRSRVGFVFQAFNLWDDRSVMSN